jgi:hypothetical protein
MPSIFGGEEDAKHRLPKCPRTKERREELVWSILLNINENVTYRKTISCKNVTKLNILESIYLEVNM